MMALVVVFVWCLFGGRCDRPGSAEARVESVQLAAVASSPALQARLHEAAFLGEEARSEAAAINPYLEWQSEGLGTDRTANAQDSLRLGTPFNFFGQMGPARELARTTEEGWSLSGMPRSCPPPSRRLNGGSIFSGRVERLEVRRVRLERLDTALGAHGGPPPAW